MNSVAVGYYTVIHSAVRLLGLCCSLGFYCKDTAGDWVTHIRCSFLILSEARESKVSGEGVLSGFQ